MIRYQCTRSLVSVALKAHPSRICLAGSQQLVARLHIDNKTVPSFKQLQAELVTLCKAGQVNRALNVVHAIKQLNYPLHSNIICQLLNFATDWDDKDVFASTLDFIGGNKFIYDEQMYCTVIRGLLSFYGFSEAMEVYNEMVSKGYIPRKNLLYCLFEDCLKMNNAKSACFFFEILLARSSLPPVEMLKQFIILCSNEKLHEYIMKLLEYYSSLNVPLEEELLYQLKWYFEDYNKRPPVGTYDACSGLPQAMELLADNGHCWNTVTTTVSIEGICYNCQAKIPQTVLNKTQMFELSSFFTDKLEQESKLLSSSRPGSSKTSQMHSLKRLIKTKGPFDYVVDGLNVAYGGNSKFNFDKILQLWKRLNKNQSVKILVVGGNQLIHHLSNRIDGQMSSRKAIQHYTNQGLHLFIKHNRVMDDLYLINATLMSGSNTMIVSNDRFRDHLHHVASSYPAMIRLLKKWQMSSQVKMLFKNGSLCALVYPPCYTTAVHMDNAQSCYHIPATNQHWLCIRKT